MKSSDSSPYSEPGNSVAELILLYQFSNTMLSTIRLNKLTHLILTAITTPSSNLFERAALFMRNEKSDVLQGMLGITRRLEADLQIVGDEDILGSRWDLSDETISRQRATYFSMHVRQTRIDIDDSCALIHQIFSERKPCRSDENICHHCQTCRFIKALCNGAFVAIPLVCHDKTIGMIVVDNPDTGREISNVSMTFLRLFANQAGMAIENSMLYSRIEEAHLNLKDARERLKHGERMAAIGEMAANLVHELKNPLVTIGGFAGRLLKSLPVETQQHHYADTIVSEACRLEKMLADILAFSRKPTICFSACDLKEIIQDCLTNCATTFEDHNIKVSLSDDSCSSIVSGDAHQLKQVFLNLILNACDVMQEGGELLFTLTQKEVAPDKKTIIVCVEDSGGGIQKEIMPQIFNPFFTTKNHGTGLGLAIAHRIIINHFGTIDVHSSANGAVFTVSLPLVA
ncbi:MAG TPA: GAF domain-containing protein [Desulfuromonadales bacterium]|nr:GAF domain-containing protein [Desulfuromonadales bacterium]